MSTVWITGAKGFMGRHLARHLQTCGHVVRGVGHGIRSESEASAWGISQWINGAVDAANLEALRRSGEVPEVVFHLAGGSSVGASLATPLEDFSRTEPAITAGSTRVRSASHIRPTVDTRR